MAGQVRIDIDGTIATITNDNPDKHNAFDDDMDAQLFEILASLSPAVRAIIWRGEGKSFSSGRDVASIGTNISELSHHELMRRGHRGIQQLWTIDAPVIVACKGWVMGGSFLRGVVSDMVLTGRVMTADEALSHGIVSRVVPEAALDATVLEIAEQIVAAPAVTIKLARTVLRHLSQPAVRASMDDEMIYQTSLNRSDDFAEFRAARAESRPANYTGS